MKEGKYIIKTAKERMHIGENCYLEPPFHSKFGGVVTASLEIMYMSRVFAKTPQR